jgi:flavin-binding protein dodecin
MLSVISTCVIISSIPIMSSLQTSCKEESIYSLLRCLTFLVHLMTRIADVVELVSSSDKSWQDAAQVALEEAKKTIRGITGVEIGDMTAKVDPNTGNITEYHTGIKVAFGVEH